jgi:hypothetical protein
MKAKRLLFVTFLSASICAFVCYTASAKFTNEMPSIQTTSSVDGHEINNVNIQPDGTQMLYGSELGSTKADVKNASTDSINLSCVFVYDKNEIDRRKTSDNARKHLRLQCRPKIFEGLFHSR